MRGAYTSVVHEWAAALKEATGARDEVYAVIDGREHPMSLVYSASSFGNLALNREENAKVLTLLEKADREGYWQRPHEVRVDFETTRPTHAEVARAVLVGQQVVETGGVVRS